MKLQEQMQYFKKLRELDESVVSSMPNGALDETIAETREHLTSLLKSSRNIDIPDTADGQ